MNALHTDTAALRCYEITFTGSHLGAIGAFHEITATRFAASSHEALLLLYEPLPIAFQHVQRPVVREIPSPFDWKSLFNYVTNTKTELDVFRGFMEGMSRTITRAAERATKGNATWHDDPDGGDHALYHAPADQQFPAEQRLIAIAELVSYILTETPAGLRVCDRLRLPDDPPFAPAPTTDTKIAIAMAEADRLQLSPIAERKTYGPTGADTMDDDHGLPCSEIRVLPVGGGGNALVGLKSYRKEMKFRRDRNRELGYAERFEMPSWDSLKIYWKAGEGVKEGGK